MSGRMWFLKNLLFCVLVGQAIAEKITKNEAIMFEMFNGKFDDSAQISGSNSSRDLLQVLFSPVIVRNISLKPLLYFLEAVNKVIVRVSLRTVEERTPGIVTMEVYNITKPSLYKGPPQTFNRTEIENLKADEVEHIDDCEADFQYDIDHFVGGSEICQDTVNGKHTIYGITIYCDKYTASIPVVAPEKSSIMPYYIEHTSDRYPLIDAPDNYTPVCDKQNAVDNQ